MQMHDWSPHMHTDRILPHLIGVMDVKALIEADCGTKASATQKVPRLSPVT
jgi:hypothetical protein